MQNSTPITVIWSMLEPEEEFQYGGRLFFSKPEVVVNIAAVD